MTGNAIRTNRNIDILIHIEEEKAIGKGEDAAVSWTNYLSSDLQSGILACLDGLGGSGAQKYPKAGNWTGARLGAFSCGRLLVYWFKENHIAELGLQNYTAEKICRSLEQALSQCIEQLAKQPSSSQSARIVSNMVKSFPTTLAAALISSDYNSIRTLFLWAGDSRCYLLTKQGLCQVTKDDLKRDLDPFENLLRDGGMSNVVCGEGFSLHCIERRLNEPFIVITATDGCFGYLNSPMAFESLLLDSLMDSNAPIDWERNLRLAIGEVTGDDYTLQAAAVGFDSFETLKDYFLPVRERFQQLYGQRLQLARGEEDLRAIWNDYKQGYMGD